MNNKKNFVINITPKDIKDFNFSMSGEVIDELAHSAGEWTSEELYSHNFDYEPSEPYNFNFESDLLANTKTIDDYLKICRHSEIQAEEMLNANYAGPLQAGAYVALNYPDKWASLLKDYTEAVKNQDIDEMELSPKYAKELQEARDDYYEQVRKEWLYGDYHGYEGVVRLIAKYFTEDRDNGRYDDKKYIYTFTIPREEAEQLKEDEAIERLTAPAIKRYLLSEIRRASNNQHNKDEALRLKRKEERERQEAYKAERAKQAEAERIAKLSAMTIN